MNKSWWKAHWALIPVVLFYIGAAAVYLLAGEHAQIAVSDNLDLFQSQYQMLRITGTFYAKDALSLFLGGISRDVLPSEWSLTSFLYQAFEPLLAYELLYFVKITIAILSFALLAGELDRSGALSGRRHLRKPAGTAAQAKASGSAHPAQATDKTAHLMPDPEMSARWNLSVLCGLAYGILNLFPSFGICFASIPLLVWLVLRLEREERKGRCVLWLLGILAYPLLSYFSYFGFFLIAYLCGAFLFKSIGDSVCGKKDPRTGIRGRKGFHPDLRLLAAVIALSAGSIACEWRLFGQMLFSDEATIRETMVQTSLSAGQIVQWIGDVMVNGIDMHCESVHKWVVLPVCLIYLVILNAGYVRRRRLREAPPDLYNLAFCTLLFNSVIYGLYYSEGMRALVETILPPLTGFQFNRTAFFNPFLWYGMFYIAMYRLILWIREGMPAPAAAAGRRDAEELPGEAAACISAQGEDASSAPCASCPAQRLRRLRLLPAVPWAAAAAAIAVILLTGSTYNDLLNTAKADVKRVLGMEESDTLDYAEFYSADLFDEILEDIGYDGEWSVAYGLHPAVLNYSGISTLDGYLGFYSQEYKEAFREVIAPALEENEATRVYYDDWGARCYIYSGHNTTVVEAVHHYTHTEDTIDIDTAALADLGCRYIFSRICITNADEKELTLTGTYTDESSPYTIYVYEVN